jgi:5-enolpyruvylshikimate-3-phosphate synthase
MSAAVLACGAAEPVIVNDASVVAKSYPGFWEDFDSLERIAP